MKNNKERIEIMKNNQIYKIYEALSAIADKRYEIKEDCYLIFSSDHSKAYTVKNQGNLYSSNDNATLWQHYAGYPILTVLFLQQKLAYQEEFLPYFKDIPWKSLNNKYKNDYEKSLQEAFQSLEEETIENINKSCQNILEELSSLSLTIKGNRVPLIKEKVK